MQARAPIFHIILLVVVALTTADSPDQCIAVEGQPCYGSSIDHVSLLQTKTGRSQTDDAAVSEEEGSETNFGRAPKDHAAVGEEASDTVREKPDMLSRLNLSTLNHSIWNNTAAQGIWSNAVVQAPQFVQRAVHEIEVEVARPAEFKNKIVFVLLAMLCPLCGFDRCFMGQVCCGFFKCCTCGGCFFWMLLDYVVCLYIALSKYEEIHMLGYNGTFDRSTIDGAFWACLLIFVGKCLISCRGGKKSMEQYQKQQELQNLIAKTRVDLQLNVPLQHQALGFMPSSATRMLRRAGALGENATMPEVLALFLRLDKDNDGVIDEKELREGLADQGLCEEQVRLVMASADTNRDGRIDQNEFLLAFGMQYCAPTR